MMGWRVGYIAYPEDGSGALAAQLLKVQDTIPVCGAQLRCAALPEPRHAAPLELPTACHRSILENRISNMIFLLSSRTGTGPCAHVVASSSRPRKTFTCAAVPPLPCSQYVALGAVEAGRDWVAQQARHGVLLPC